MSDKYPKTIQLWPGGKSVTYQGDPWGEDLKVRLEPDDWQLVTDAERRDIQIEVLAERYQEREILHCDSCLVDDLMKLSYESASELAQEFSLENVKNLYADPSDWELEQCKEWLEEHSSASLPDPNPWGLDEPALMELLGYEPDQKPAEWATIEIVRENVIADINNEVIDGLDDWRDAVRNNAQAEEIYQWFRVTEWLGDELAAIDECVLNNNYGTWFGRGGCGQSLLMDGVLQRIAARHI